MENDEVIENGFVIVRENRIHLLGNMTDYLASSFKADQVMDLKGKTIMPGIVDVHAHLGAFRFGISPKNTGNTGPI